MAHFLFGLVSLGPETVCAALLFALCRWRASFAILCVPLAAVHARTMLNELHEPALYGSIQADLDGHADGIYAVVAALMVIAPLTGGSLRCWRLLRRTRLYRPLAYLPPLRAFFSPSVSPRCAS